MSPQHLADTLVREHDPATSQEAAQVAAKSLTGVRLAVLELIAEQGQLQASEINRLYDYLRPTKGWPKTAADSPRKRAGELASEKRGLHYLAVVGTGTGENGVRESIYGLTDGGRTYLREHP